MRPLLTHKPTITLAVAALAGVMVAFVCLQLVDAVWATIFWLVALKIAWEDFCSLTVSDLHLAVLGAGGLIRSALSVWDASNPQMLITNLAEIIAIAALLGLALYALAVLFRWIRRVEGLGLGDIKLISVAALWMPVEIVFQGIAVAAITALLLLAIIALRMPEVFPADRRIPFATFLAPSLWLVWMGQQINSIGDGLF